MSYPNPRYHGDSGEVSARFEAHNRDPDLLIGDRVRVHYLATGASTNGQFGLYRWEMSAEAGGAEPHFHRSFSESFFILSGTVHVYDGNEWSARTSGDFEFVPEGGIHGFRNDSGEPASMLLLFAPGAPREGYFEGLADGVANGTALPPDFFEVHDNHYL
jgi:mannose-6-phosphate isomerase-like protein (cupin superfamily)